MRIANLAADSSQSCGLMNRRLAYAQLLRIPNVFTAITDVSIGLIATSALISVWPWIIISSACLYCSGMAWNDYFDRHIDAQERPDRPIPSGRISPNLARGIAVGLSIVGVASAMIVSTIVAPSSPLPGIISIVLLAMILAYDARLKATPFGPLAMGGCRFLNVCLGFSLSALGSLAIVPAAIVGTYVVGITFVAREEVGRSRKPVLMFGLTLIAAALLGAILVPTLGLAKGRSLAVILISLLAARLVVLSEAALREPSPRYVQSLVRSAILGLIVLDSALATSLVGPLGLLLLVLLIPAQLLGRWVYST